MKERLGIVLWWSGTVMWACAAAVGMWINFRHGNMAGVLASVLIGLPVAALLWAACFVVAGTFFKPPKRYRQQQ